MRLIYVHAMLSLGGEGRTKNYPAADKLVPSVFIALYFRRPGWKNESPLGVFIPWYFSLHAPFVLGRIFATVLAVCCHREYAV